MRPSIFALLAFTSPCLANEQAAQAVIDTRDAVAKLGDALGRWNGGIPDAYRLLKVARELSHKMGAAASDPNVKMEARVKSDEEQQRESEGFAAVEDIIVIMGTIADDFAGKKVQIQRTPGAKTLLTQGVDAMGLAARELGQSLEVSYKNTRLSEVQQNNKQIAAMIQRIRTSV